MTSFKSHAVTISGEGSSSSLEAVGFAGRLTERDLEDHVIAHPALLGETLLVLGRQLSDFVEDNKRLDVLALDAVGEIVLIELKVALDFGFTDLQALAYAGAYADRPTVHFVRTLAHACRSEGGDEGIRVGAGLDPDPTVEQARGAILDFLEIDDFDEWNPSKHIRIKLVAPGFPRRVLNSVRWLGDVHGLSIEAIRAQLFDLEASYQLHFDRLLPLPGAEEFDLSIRAREENIRRENRDRRKPVFSLLVRNGVLVTGDRVFLSRGALPSQYRNAFGEGDPAFEGTVDESHPTQLRWRPADGAEAKLVAPASVGYEACVALLDDEVESFGTAVAENFIHEASGKTLAELAIAEGLWEKS